MISEEKHTEPLGLSNLFQYWDFIGSIQLKSLADYHQVKSNEISASKSGRGGQNFVQLTLEVTKEMILEDICLPFLGFYDGWQSAK